MSISPRRLLLPSSLLLVIVSSYPGCGDENYIGGQCEDPQDCQSPTQYLEGGTCRDNQCVCADAAHHICCELGDTREDCYQRCLPCELCRDRPATCPPPECSSDTECAGPPDPRCGVGRCVGGKCTLEITPGPIVAGVRGDCMRDLCMADGRVESMPDPYDVYDDGNQCTHDLCDQGTRINAPLAGLLCPVTGAGRCYEAQCVECLSEDPTVHCPPGLACIGMLCVPPHCGNSTTDRTLGETARDCGGPCGRCDIGERCASGTDCNTGVCEMGVCKVPTCDDGVRNDSESGVDCGAPSCPRCPAGEGCRTGEECASGVCWAGACEAPSCTDGIRNGGEKDIDCGGACPACR
ncbi:hypothetical protein WMF38_46295 [Sorangium sp. So ce118]